MLVLRIFLTLIVNLVVRATEFTVTTSLPGTTLSEGDSGPYTIQCDITATNLTVNATYTYLWLKDDAIVSVKDQLQADFVERFSVVFIDMINTTYPLSLTSIAISDSGRYTCVVAEGSLDSTTSVETITSLVVASSSETIAVRYFPSADPICNANIESPVERGRVLTLTCSSDVGNPRVLVQWDFGINSIVENVDENSPVVTGETITLEKDAFLTDTSSFTCKVSSPETYPGEERTCSVGPFTLIPSTGYVSVTPANWWFQQEGGDAEFRCRLSSLGTVRWFTVPPTDQSGFEMSGPEVYTLKNIAQGDAGKRVICEGTLQNGDIYWEYAEVKYGTTTQPPTTTAEPTTTTTPVNNTASGTTVGVVVETSPLFTSGFSGTTPVLNITTLVSPGAPEELDIILIAVVAAAGAFILIVVLVVVCACCCCCRKQDPKDKGPAPHEEYDWEAGLTPSNARTAPVLQPQVPPSPIPDRGPDPVIVRNPTHGVPPPASEYMDAPQPQTLINDQDHLDEPEMSPYLKFAMTNLQVDDDEAQDDRLRIPRAVAREPPQVRRKSKKAKMVPSGSFVSRGHPLKRTPLGNDTFPEELSDSMYSSLEHPSSGSSQQTTPYASVERPSVEYGLPPDVTVTRDPSGQMPDVTVGLTDNSPIVPLNGNNSPSPSPDNTAVPRRKLPAGARAAIGPGSSNTAFLTQPQSQQTARLSAEIQAQDIVPILGPSPETNCSHPVAAGPPAVKPPTYEAVSRLKAQGLINSGFQPGNTDTMIIHDVKNNSPSVHTDLTNVNKGQGSVSQSNSDSLKYF